MVAAKCSILPQSLWVSAEAQPIVSQLHFCTVLDAFQLRTPFPMVRESGQQQLISPRGDLGCLLLHRTDYPALHVYFSSKMKTLRYAAVTVTLVSRGFLLAHTALHRSASLTQPGLTQPCLSAFDNGQE